MQPQVPIEVDEATGVWTTDGLPMLYVPRHFFVNNHTAIEEALGREKYATLLYDAGYKSAYFWCASEAKTHGLSGLPVFEHYLKRLSQRGWGQFRFQTADAKTGAAEIRLENSLFVLAQAAHGAGNPVSTAHAASSAGNPTSAAHAASSAGNPASAAHAASSAGGPASAAHAASSAGGPTTAGVALRQAAAAGTPAGTRCYMFSGWFAGAMDWVLDTSSVGVKTHSAELQCGGQGHSHCLFRVRPQI